MRLSGFRLLSLTARAKIGGALAEADLLDGGTAVGARLLSSIVDPQPHLKMTGIARCITEIAKCGATLGNGVGEDFLNGFEQPTVALEGNMARRPGWVNACGK